MCDFAGMKEPEMVKRRPVVVVSPRLRYRKGLCAVVPMSTTRPQPPEAYHHRIRFGEPLPAPYDSEYQWVKADMIYTVAFHRLFLLTTGKDDQGKRQYDARVISKADLRTIQSCILHGLGMADLTTYM